MTPSLLNLFLIHLVFFVVLGYSVDPVIAATPSNEEIYGPDAEGICYRGSPANEVIVPCPTRTRKNMLSTPLIIGIVAASVVVLVLIAALVIWRRHVHALHHASDNSHFDFVSTSASTKVPTNFRPESPSALSMRSVLSRCSNLVSTSGSRWNKDSTRGGHEIEVELSRHHLSIANSEDAEQKRIDLPMMQGNAASGSKIECKQTVEVYVIPSTPDPIRRYSDVERELGRSRSRPPEW